MNSPETQSRHSVQRMVRRRCALETRLPDSEEARLTGPNVTFNLADFVTGNVANRIVIVTPQSTPMVSGSTIVISDRKSYYTDSTGSFTATNMVGPATYLVNASGPLSTTTFYITTADGIRIIKSTGYLTVENITPSSFCVRPSLISRPGLRHVWVDITVWRLM